jgi:hypothetical protein
MTAELALSQAHGQNAAWLSRAQRYRLTLDVGI